MRRQNLYLLLLATFLLLLPISKDNGFRFGLFDYITDISNFLMFLLDPLFAAEPTQKKFLALIYLVQSIGWIAFSASLFILGIAGLIRNRSQLKFVAVLSGLVLVHGVIEVILAYAMGQSPISNAIFDRFGLDFLDFIDDYDALLNSTLVPIGLVVWYFVSRKRFSASPKFSSATLGNNEGATEISSS
jgi:hypothetical protein